MKYIFGLKGTLTLASSHRDQVLQAATVEEDRQMHQRMLNVQEHCTVLPINDDVKIPYILSLSSCIAKDPALVTQRITE